MVSTMQLCIVVLGGMSGSTVMFESMEGYAGNIQLCFGKYTSRLIMLRSMLFKGSIAGMLSLH